MTEEQDPCLGDRRPWARAGAVGEHANRRRRVSLIIKGRGTS